MDNKTQASGGSFFGLLFLLLLGLKLTDNIDWSWWWVTAPLWAPAAIFMMTLTIVLAFASRHK